MGIRGIEVLAGGEPEQPAIYGKCTACGAIETKLNQKTHTIDYSNIGESAEYPAGFGCELCD